MLSAPELQSIPRSQSYLRKNGFYRLWTYDSQQVTRRDEDQVFFMDIVREGERLVIAGANDSTHQAVLGQTSAPLENYFLNTGSEYAYLMDATNVREFSDAVRRLRSIGKNNVYVFFKEQDTMAQALPTLFEIHETYSDFHMRFSADHAVLAGLAYGRPLAPPRRAVIEVHEKCNLKCDFCWTHSPLLKSEGDDRGRKVAIDEDVFYKYIDELAAVPVDFVELCAIGDPLYHPKIWEMIRYVKRKGLRVRISTNATLINKNNAEDIIRWGVDEMYINVSGGDARSYADIHNVSEKIFENLKRNLCYLAEMKKKSPGCPLDMEHVNVITEKNAYSIRGMLHFAKMAGASKVNFRSVWEHKDFLEKLNLKKATIAFLLDEIPEYTRLAEEFGIKHNFAHFTEQLRNSVPLKDSEGEPAGTPGEPPQYPIFESIPEVQRETAEIEWKNVDPQWLSKPLREDLRGNDTAIAGDIPICAVSYQFTLLGTGDLLRFCCRGDKVIGEYSSLKEQWVGEDYNAFRDQWRRSFQQKKNLCVGCPHVEENYRYADMLRSHGIQI